MTELKDLMKKVMDGTADSAEIDKLTFNTISWINENTSWDGGTITDNESELITTTYKLTHNGSDKLQRRQHKCGRYRACHLR